MGGEVAMGGYSRAGVYASHLSAAYFCYGWELMKDELMMLHHTGLVD